MLDDWFEYLKFDLPWETFRRLPRHPAYRYEYLNGQVRISARPLQYHCRLELQRFLTAHATPAGEGWTCRPLSAEDWPSLRELFANAFSTVVPLCHVLSVEERDLAAKQTLERTRGGNDGGPLLNEASFVLEDSAQGELLGAALVTWLSGSMRQHVDPGARDQRLESDAPRSPSPGQPHLTWIFVEPFRARQGAGETLLWHVADSLHALGHSTLASTFLLGNHASMLWHWRMGFELLSHILSPRRLDQP